MKTLLCLGAGPAQLPVIEAARAAGHRVVTCDSRAHVPGHWLADEAHFISPAQRDDVLALARTLRPHGVIGFASELCGVAAAHVAEALGLPGCGAEAADCLSDKESFRALAAGCGLGAGEWRVFTPEEMDEAWNFAAALDGPAVVKPTDNTGSVGVSLHVTDANFAEAWAKAWRHSHAGRIMVERQQTSTQPQLGGDGIVHEGELAFLGVGEAVPVEGIEQCGVVGKLFPAALSPATHAALRAQLQTLLSAAGFRSGGFNFDALVLADGTPWVIEIAPRHGGNQLTEAIGRCWGFDVAAEAVAMALDGTRVPPKDVSPSSGHASITITAPVRGRWRGVSFAEELAPFLVRHSLLVDAGEEVRPFTSAADACGNVQIAFPDTATMHRLAPSLHGWIRVDVEPAMSS